MFYVAGHTGQYTQDVVSYMSYKENKDLHKKLTQLVSDQTDVSCNASKINEELQPIRRRKM